MMRDMMRQCCGADGRPDFDKMTRFMERHDRTGTFDAIGWALFFIWVGAAWFAGLSFGAGLLGVAIITLGMQGVRKLFDVGVEGFWIFVGIAMAIGATWELLEIERPLAPLVLIVVGLVILYWGVLRPRRAK